MKWLKIVLCWLLAGGVFYGMFFQLAPYICTLIPSGQWQGLMKVGVYLIVAYFGGIGIPFAIVFFSIMTLWKSKIFND